MKEDANEDAARVIIVVDDATETVDTLYPLLSVQEGFVPVVAGPERRRYQIATGCRKQPPSSDLDPQPSRKAATTRIDCSRSVRT